MKNTGKRWAPAQLAKRGVVVQEKCDPENGEKNQPETSQGKEEPEEIFQRHEHDLLGILGFSNPYSHHINNFTNAAAQLEDVHGFFHSHQNRANYLSSTNFLQ